MNRLDSIDEILLERLGKGDEDAFGILFRRYYVQLCRYAALFVKEKDSAEEIVMNLFVSLWENKENFGRMKSPGAYLFRAVRNRCMNWLRDSKASLNIDKCVSLTSFHATILPLNCRNSTISSRKPYFRFLNGAGWCS